MTITLSEWKLENPDAASRPTPWWMVSRTGQVEAPNSEPPAAPLPRRTAADCAFPVKPEPPFIRPLVIRRKSAGSAPEGGREA
jgi:hypothetical protein